MDKHTPGPWFVDEKSYIWRRDPKELYENGGGVAGDKPLACCYKGWYGEGMIGYPAAANAQLIAASPDLLAALKAILPMAVLGSERDGYCFDRKGEVCPGCQEQLKKARAAIRKAEGEL